MVEVKPPWGQQKEAQWHNEVKALMEAVTSETDAGFDLSDVNVVHFVALGRNAGLDIRQSFEDFDTKGVFDLEPHQKEWDDILKGIDDWTELEANADGAVVTDWRSAFDLFGVRRSIKPLTELCELPLITEASLSLLARMRKALLEREHSPPPPPWRPLLTLSVNYCMEEPECTSLLKKLANS